MERRRTAVVLDLCRDSPQESGVFSLRAARLATALVAMIGVIGLSLLPAEHVHPDQHDGSDHHSAIVHRHVSSHHPHAGAPLPHWRALTHANLEAGDDHADAWQATQAFVAAGKKPAPGHPLLTSPYLNHILPEPSGARSAAVMPWVPPPHGPPFDPARPLRAPPSLA